MLVVDHVIWGAADIERAGEWFWKELGLASYEGGRHPQYGTANRIVPLGDSYVEIMGVEDAEAAAANPLGQFLLGSVADGDRWIAWCLRTEDVDAEAQRIGSVAVAGERHRPDGTVVSWRLAGLEIALTRPPLPFFIQWDDPQTMPGRVPLEHRAPARGVGLVTVVGDEAALRAHIGTGTVEVVVAAGAPAIRSVVVDGVGPIGG